jgi:hypothetical protein
MRPLRQNCERRGIAPHQPSGAPRQSDAANLPASLLLSAHFSVLPAATRGQPVLAHLRAKPMSTEKTNQSWGGRFSEPVDAFVARFTASV